MTDVTVNARILGKANKIHKVLVKDTDTVATLKERIKEASGIQKQRLVHKKNILEDGQKIEECRIKSEDTVDVYCTAFNA